VEDPGAALSTSETPVQGTRQLPIPSRRRTPLKGWRIVAEEWDKKINESDGSVRQMPSYSPWRRGNAGGQTRRRRSFRQALRSGDRPCQPRGGKHETPCIIAGISPAGRHAKILVNCHMPATGSHSVRPAACCLHAGQPPDRHRRRRRQPWAQGTPPYPMPEPG
jgi:hypothetical protein